MNTSINSNLRGGTTNNDQSMVAQHLYTTACSIAGAVSRCFDVSDRLEMLNARLGGPPADNMPQSTGGQAAIPDNLSGMLMDNLNASERLAAVLENVVNRLEGRA